LIIGKKAAKDLEALKLKPEDLFLGIEDLKFKFYQENMLEHNSEKDAAVLLEQYEKLRTDLQGLPGDLVANIVKQMNLHIKEVRRWKNEIHNKQLEMQEKNVTKLEKLYNAFYPGGEMQERHDNFIPYYLQFGKEWFGDLKRACNPLQAVCHIFVEE
jgi:bacillithiol synthase